MARTSALLVLAAAAVAQAQVGPPPSSCSGTVNQFAPWTQQTFVNKTVVSSTGGGLRFVSNPPGSNTPLTVLHLYGTPYEMGLAYGQLMAVEIRTLVPQAFEYLREQINASISSLPAPIRNAIETEGLDFAMNLTANLTAPFTPQRYFDIMAGMAAGSGVDYEDILNTNLIPELTKAACSILGAWGDATAGTNGSLVGLRALDWGTDGPFNAFAQLTVWHPLPGDGFAYSSLSWSGFVGALTGYSSSGVAICEKVYDAYTGLQNIVGKPWTFVLGDILQNATDMDDALSQVATAERTCAIWMGLMSLPDMQAKILQYSYEYVNIYNDRNFPAYPPAHPLYKDALFVNKHVQPSSEPCMGDLVTWLYGNGLSAQNVYKYITALEQTGNMHLCVYDMGNAYMYCSIASVAINGNVSTVVNAFDRQPFGFDMAAQWATALSDY